MSIDNANIIGCEPCRTIKNILQQWLTGERLENLRHGRIHSFSLASGENDDTCDHSSLTLFVMPDDTP